MICLCSLADQQALTDHAKDPQTICRVYRKCGFGLPCSWIGSQLNRQSLFKVKFQELAELSMYYMNLVSLARLERNPTVKTEIAQKGFGESIPTGFLVYPIAQAADITASRLTMFLLGQTKNQ